MRNRRLFSVLDDVIHRLDLLLTGWMEVRSKVSTCRENPYLKQIISNLHNLQIEMIIQKLF